MAPSTAVPAPTPATLPLPAAPFPWLPADAEVIVVGSATWTAIRLAASVLTLAVDTDPPETEYTSVHTACEPPAASAQPSWKNVGGCETPVTPGGSEKCTLCTRYASVGPSTSVTARVQ